MTDIVESRREGSLAYVAIRSFQTPDARRSQDYETLLHRQRDRLTRTIEEVLDSSRLILDLRYNGGGTAWLATETLGYFIDRRVALPTGRAAARLPSIIPRGTPYRGRVVVLVNEYTASGGEMVAAFLRRYAGAQIVGGTTVGAEAGLSVIGGAEGTTLRVGLGSLDPEKRPTYQGRGIAPDVSIPVTIERLRAEGPQRALANVEADRLRAALALLDAEEIDGDFVAQLERGSEELIGRWLGAAETESGAAAPERDWDDFQARIFDQLGARGVECPQSVSAMLGAHQGAACAVLDLSFAEFKKAWRQLVARHDDLRLVARDDWTKVGEHWRKRAYLLDNAPVLVWFSEKNRGLMLTYG